MKMNKNVFRKYDIRGIYEKEFDLDFAHDLGRAVVSLINKRRKSEHPTICVGQDVRVSSSALVKALSDGIQKSGGKVILLGLVPSPLTYFSTFHLGQNVDSVMVTGSHNPPEYNGFKISVEQKSLFGEDVQHLKDIMLSQDFFSGRGEETSLDIKPAYVNRYKKEFGDLSGVPVVLDCGNGTVGVVARQICESLDIQAEILFEEPDGNFPNHHPDPSQQENMEQLVQKVKETQARIGIAFDGDGDRIGVVDQGGQIISCDDLMVFLGRSVLKNNAEATIVGDVKCSEAFFEDVKKQGGKAVMSMTGCSIMRERVRVEEALFGGELSGHLFFADRNYGYDDALYAGLRVIEILKNTQKPILETISDLPRRWSTPEIRKDISLEKRDLILQKVKEYFSQREDYKDISYIDGVRVIYEDGWALVRVSHTEPQLTLRFEAQSARRLQEIKREIEGVLHSLHH